GAQAQGRHGAREWRWARSGAAVRWLQAIRLGARERSRGHRGLYGDQVRRDGFLVFASLARGGAGAVSGAPMARDRPVAISLRSTMDFFSFSLVRFRSGPST